MGVKDVRLPGEFPAGDQGYPRSRIRGWRQSMDRILSTAICMISLGVAVLGMTAALGSTVMSGVLADNPGGVVREVDPAGFGWASGIRPGQRVVATQAADEPGGWAIETAGRDGVVRSGAAPQVRLLEGTRPIAFFAVLMAAVALVRLPRRRAAAEAMAIAAVVLAAFPIAIQNEAGVSSAVLALALFLPAAWLARWTRLPGPARLAILGASLAIIFLWLGLRAVAAPTFPVVEQARLSASVGGTLAMAAAVIAWRKPSISVLSHPRLIDAASLAVLVGAAAVLLVAGVPILVVALTILLVAALYPSFRHATLGLLDRAFLAEQRERLNIAAAEEERARLARELHDAPLQDLAGVIRRLERVEGVRAEGDALRAIADELRRVTTDLHPPILDDLGLVPAIEFVASAFRAPGATTAISVEMNDHTGVSRADRPPADVELNALRIVQEALANAVHHAAASVVGVHGEVSATRITVMVEDDGRGIAPNAAGDAVRRGRLGLGSMRRRAEIMGASLDVTSRRGSGTQVALRWDGEA